MRWEDRVAFGASERGLRLSSSIRERPGEPPASLISTTR